MESLFTTLTEALYGNFAFALIASFVWGVLSILLSPCHLSSIPLIIGFLAAHDEKKTSRNFLLAFVFAIGILLTIAVIGIITASIGRIMGDVGPYGKFLVAVIFIIVGLYLMDVIHLPGTGVKLQPFGIKSVYFSAFSLGLIFGIALGPCTFAYMAPVLGIVFQMAGTNIAGSGALLLTFGLGHCGVIVVAGGLATWLQIYLNWTNKSNAVLWIKRVAGFLVVLGGICTFFTT